MPTLLSHPAVPLALGLGLGGKVIPGRLLGAGVLLSALPDLDVIGFHLGVPYAAAAGHRGFSHSLVLAMAVASVVAWLFRRGEGRYPAAAGFLFLCMASHGLLDALTTGGKGVALLWPFSEGRVFAPVQVIRVSPLSLGGFLSDRGFAVLASEVKWIWLPAALLGLSLRGLRKVRASAPPVGPDPA